MWLSGARVVHMWVGDRQVFPQVDDHMNYRVGSETNSLCSNQIASTDAGMEESDMSDIEGESKLIDEGQKPNVRGWDSFTAAVAMPAILLSAMLGVKIKGERDQRGVTTVEYIFGALIGIAIVGCIAALFASGTMDKMAEGVMKWIFGQRPGSGK